MSDQLDMNDPHLEMTADIVAAYVSNNPVPANELASLIASIYASISALEQQPVVEEVQLSPAVNPKKSVFPDYIVSLEDGRKFKSMKRHVGLLGMTPEEYRTKWGLPVDYPMVAPSYSAARSALAKTMGLGRKPKAAPEPVKKGRKPKAA
ncbi:Ros/MucR family transcriptional regulator [Mesorhizobium sp. A623]